MKNGLSNRIVRNVLLLVLKNVFVAVAALALALGLPLWTSMAGVAFGNLLSFAYRVWYLHGLIRRQEWHS